MKFHSDKDKKAFIKNCKAACNGHSAIADYLGCYRDKIIFKEFTNLIGENLTPV